MVWHTVGDPEPTEEQSHVSIGLKKEEKDQLVAQFRTHEGDTGSPSVQIAILDRRIKQLTAHVQVHAKDHHTRLGLLKMVQQRKRLLNYLKREDFDRYKAIRDELKIRHN
jgi:small subunit ribosomal protein S15